MEQKDYIKNRVAKILSEILSDKHECKVVLTFEKAAERKEL